MHVSPDVRVSPDVNVNPDMDVILDVHVILDYAYKINVHVQTRRTNVYAVVARTLSRSLPSFALSLYPSFFLLLSYFHFLFPFFTFFLTFFSISLFRARFLSLPFSIPPLSHSLPLFLPFCRFLSLTLSLSFFLSRSLFLFLSLYVLFLSYFQVCMLRTIYSYVKIIFLRFLRQKYFQW